MHQNIHQRYVPWMLWDICHRYIMNMQHTDHRYVPRVLIDIMRSYLFMLVSTVFVSWMALALFTKMSIPPNVFTVESTAFFTCSSSRMSTTHGRHLPPEASTVHDMTIQHLYPGTWLQWFHTRVPIPYYKPPPHRSWMIKNVGILTPCMS